MISTFRRRPSKRATPLLAATGALCLGALVWLALSADSSARKPTPNSPRVARLTSGVPLGGESLTPISSAPTFKPPTSKPPAVKPRPTPTRSASVKPTPTKRLVPVSGRLVRVGLRTKGAALRFWCESPVLLYDPSRPQIIERIVGEFSIARDGETLRVSLLQPTSDAALLALAKFKSSRILALRSELLLPVRATSDDKSARWGRPYRGTLEVTPQEFTFDPSTHKSDLRLVNLVALEEYLQGVVPWEMSPSAPLEALKAQAICARTQTLAKIAVARHQRDGYEICDFDHCQGYPGTENETPQTTRAVKETRGLAIFHNGQIADAVYGTNSGGITANSGDVWRGQEPYLFSVNDSGRALPRTESEWAAYCATPLPSFARPSEAAREELKKRRAKSPRTAALYGPTDWPEFYRWSRVVPAATMNAAFADTGIYEVSSISVAERSATGRIKRLLVTGPSNYVSVQDLHFPQVELKGDGQIRSMLSKRLGSTTALPSSTFVVKPQRDEAGQIVAWQLQGAGWGHGVGMCQRGAQNHALAGWSAPKIVAHYFRGVEVRKIN